MEFTPIRPIEPLWESQTEQPEAVGRDASHTLFADVFQSARSEERRVGKE